MRQFRQWRRNVPAEWKRAEAPEQIHPRFFETALRTAWKNGAVNRRGLEGAIRDVRRFLTDMGEPKHTPPATARRLAMHEQQLTDEWTALSQAFTNGNLQRITTRSMMMLFSILHLHIELGVPSALVWQHVRHAFGRKDPANKEADGRIQWPAGVISELVTIVNDANNTSNAE